MSFASRVKQIKAEKGITTEQLSATSGIAVSTLAKLLSGATVEPKLSVALSIARALDCPVGALTDDSTYIAQTLTEEEEEMLALFRRLDSHGRELVLLVAEKESERDVSRRATLLSAPRGAYRELPLYLFPVSAGVGTLVQSTDTEPLSVPATGAGATADFCLRVSGNSMEPKFFDGDLLLVREQPEVGFGELGIFIGDGEGYFKRFMGDRLHSLNPTYTDIPLSHFREFRCCGKVVGRLRKKEVPT